MLDLDASTSPVALNADRDVVSQIKLAFANPLPLLIGALLGALVPVATFTVGHAELGAAGWASVPGVIVVGGCLFSAITVYKWGRRAFDSAFKALGFVVLSEGVMTFSHVPWLSMVVLGFLVAINAVANGSNLAIAHLDAERVRRAAEAVEAAVLPRVEAPALPAVVLPAVVEVVVPAPVVEVPAVVAQPVEAQVVETPAIAKKAPRKRASKVKVTKAPRTSTVRATDELN